MKNKNVFKLLTIILLSILSVSFLLNLKDVNAENEKLSAGKEISINNINGNLNNINIKIEFTTSVDLDGTNNALLIGLSSSDGTILTDARFVVSSTNIGIIDEDGVSIIYENAPSTIGSKKINNNNYTYTIETRDFNIVNSTKNISKLVVVGQKGEEISSTISFEEIKYKVTFDGHESLYSYNQLIEKPESYYTYDISGHTLVNSWTGDDSTPFINGTTRATKDIIYRGTGTKESHTWVDVNESIATRTNNGIKAHQECSKCGAKRLNSSSNVLVSDEDLVSVHNCEYDVSFDWTNTKSLTDKPIVRYSCKDSNCGYSIVLESGYIQLKEKEGTRLEPTEESEGSVTLIALATYEGHTASSEKTYILPKKVHNLVRHEEVLPTCDKYGNIEYYECIDCGKLFSDEFATSEIIDIIIPKSHSLVKVEESLATCTTNGNIEYYECSVCHKKFSDANGLNEIEDVVVIGKHNLIHHEASVPSCTESGNTEYYECSICNKRFSDSNGENEIEDIILPPSHTLIKNEAVAPTCTTVGNIEYYHCSKCDKNFDVDGNEIVDPFLPYKHNLLKYNAKDTTCDRDGNIEYYHCSDCGKNFKDKDGQKEVSNVVVKTTGHEYGSDGRCIRCGKVDPDYNSGSTKVSLGCDSELSISFFIPLIGLSVVVLKRRKKTI